MNDPKFEVGDKVIHNNLNCEITYGPLLFGNFYIYDLKEIEFYHVFFGVPEDEIQKIKTKKKI